MPPPNPPKPVSRILSLTEAKHLYERFEQVHCTKEVDGEVVQCPGWDPHMVVPGDRGEQLGGCRYKNSHKLCLNLEAAAKGQLILEVRPRNEEDIKREQEIERMNLSADLKNLKNRRTELDDQIMALESRMRNL